MDEDDEYSLYYEFSDRITKADKHSVAALMKNVLQQGKAFNLEQPKGIMNNATGGNFRKGRGRFPNEFKFFRKGWKKWILWITSERAKHAVVGNHS